uniref:Kelch domain-containing protein 10 n=1 Tax=Elaeophora elaphi TaxID=1147741 RepID=A0A0R3RKZ6_9BILA
MAYWTIAIGGGPKNANQAAVAIGNKIYAFGELINDDDECSPYDRLFGVHILDTETYRWESSLGESDRMMYTTLELNEEFFADENDDAVPLYIELGVTPLFRTGHTVVAYEGKLYMWGGRIESLHFSVTMYCFDPETQHWSIISRAGDAVPGRMKHSAIVHNDMMIVYGGEDDLFNFPKTVCAYHFKTRKWYNLVTEISELPSGRESHTACIIDEKMYVYGGTNMFLKDMDLDVLNLKTGRWEKPKVSGDIPCRRRDHSAWVYRGMMYIFGGFEGTERRYLNTLHEFNPETCRWRLMHPCGLPPPVPRGRHCSVLIDERVFVFSGMTLVRRFHRSKNIEIHKVACDLHVLDYG